METTELRIVPKGVCSREIWLSIDPDHIIRACAFEKGCRGNLAAVSRLVIGRPAREVAQLLRGIECQGNTSCPDQLAQALEHYLAAPAPPEIEHS